MASYNEKDIPDLGSYPVGSYMLEWAEGKHSSDAEPLQIKVQFKILEGPEGVLAGSKYTETFKLGTVDDPQAEQPDTKRNFKKAGMGWAHWKDFAKKSGIFVGDTKEEVDAGNSIHPVVVADMGARPGKDKDTGELTGRTFNNLTRYYEAGKQGAATASAPAAKAPVAASKAKATPTSKMVKCEACDPPKMIPEKLYAQHEKRHLQEAGNGDEEQ